MSTVAAGPVAAGRPMPGPGTWRNDDRRQPAERVGAGLPRADAVRTVVP